jgi:hypothetical protein
MAIICAGSKCALCDRPLSGPTVATQAFAEGPADPLWNVSDAAMHKECFINWPLRDQLIERYNSTIGSIVWGNGTKHHMNPDGEIEVIQVSGLKRE